MLIQGDFFMKRIVTAAVMFALFFAAIIARCFFVATDKSAYVNDSYNSYRVDIGTLYSNIYDRKGVRLNNNGRETVAVIEPNEKCMRELEILFSADEQAEILRELQKGYPITKTVRRTVKTKYIKQYERIIENTEDMPARHILDRACGGLEAHSSQEIGSLSVSFGINARGELLRGNNATVNDNNYDSADGIIVSLDSDIQKIAEQSASTIKKGAIVILDCETSQVLASVSRGEEYINRATANYAVGSVFKLVSAVCATENGINPTYECKGKIKVGDTVFHCQHNKSHGRQQIKTALANSCNCYFINLANILGAEKLLETAKSLGFSESFELYDNWTVSGGSMPTEADLKSAGELALFSFGQGKLNDSALHFASFISCIANGGIYSYPTLEIGNDKGSRVMSEGTAETLREYMKYVVTDGTGKNADYKSDCGGKTATAQSGIFEDGREILITYFAGFYPYDNPEYAIVVMCEDGTSGALDCCPVFRTIVEKLDEM